MGRRFGFPNESKKTIAGLGRRIYIERIRRGWTLKELSRRSGLSAAGICIVEKSSRGISTKALLKLCDAFDIGPNKLLRWKSKQVKA